MSTLKNLINDFDAECRQLGIKPQQPAERFRIRVTGNEYGYDPRDAGLFWCSRCGESWTWHQDDGRVCPALLTDSGEEIILLTEQMIESVK